MVASTHVLGICTGGVIMHCPALWCVHMDTVPVGPEALIGVHIHCNIFKLRLCHEVVKLPPCSECLLDIYISVGAEGLSDNVIASRVVVQSTGIPYGRIPSSGLIQNTKGIDGFLRYSSFINP